MVPLGEADEAELDLLSAPPGERREEILRPPIPALERRLILARLVQAWAGTVDRGLLPLGDEVPFRVPSSPADAVGLAADLEGLMDSLTVEGLPWDDIAGAVEAEHSRYFSLTLDFVRIAAEHWPKILADRGVSDPVERGRALVLAEAARLVRERPADPVIVAGSTGSVPATARLIAAIAGLPRGAVVLPGLDRDLDEAGWSAIDPAGDGEAAAHAHPQAVLHRWSARTSSRSSAPKSCRSARRARPPRPGRASCPRPCARPRRPMPGPISNRRSANGWPATGPPGSGWSRPPTSARRRSPSRSRCGRHWSGRTGPPP